MANLLPHQRSGKAAASRQSAKVLQVCAPSCRQRADTSAHAEESTRVSSDWIREEKLEAALPVPPKVTVGEVVAFKNLVHVPLPEGCCVRPRP